MFSEEIENMKERRKEREEKIEKLREKYSSSSEEISQHHRVPNSDSETTARDLPNSYPDLEGIAVDFEYVRDALIEILNSEEGTLILGAAREIVDKEDVDMETFRKNRKVG